MVCMYLFFVDDGISNWHRIQIFITQNKIHRESILYSLSISLSLYFMGKQWWRDSSIHMCVCMYECLCVFVDGKHLFHSLEFEYTHTLIIIIIIILNQIESRIEICFFFRFDFKILICFVFFDDCSNSFFSCFVFIFVFVESRYLLFDQTSWI